MSAAHHGNEQHEQPSTGGSRLLSVEASLEAALAAGTAAALQKAIRYAVRAMAAADRRTIDVSQVRFQCQL